MSPFVHMRTLRYRKTRSLPPKHTANKKQSLVLNIGSLTPGAAFAVIPYYALM